MRLDYSETGLCDQIARFIVACRIPFLIVDHVQFRRMLQIAAGSKGVQIPGRHKIRDRIVDMAEENQKIVLASIPVTSKIAIALDCWSSKCGKAFLAITGYFFTEDFSFREALLGFEPLHSSHEGKYLAEVVIRVLTKHGFLYRVIAATTDGARNNGTMMQEWKKKLSDGLSESIAFRGVFDQEFHEITHSTTHVPCIAHVIQLAANALLDDIKISAKNEGVEAKWDDRVDRKVFSHRGLPSTLEKVR